MLGEGSDRPVDHAEVESKILVVEIIIDIKSNDFSRGGWEPLSLLSQFVFLHLKPRPVTSIVGMVGAKGHQLNKLAIFLKELGVVADDVCTCEVRPMVAAHIQLVELFEKTFLESSEMMLPGVGNIVYVSASVLVVAAQVVQYFYFQSTPNLFPPQTNKHKIVAFTLLSCVSV